MQWVRKDRLTNSTEERKAKRKDRQQTTGVPRAQQKKQQWVWRPKKEMNPKTETATTTPKQIWVPKTQIYRTQPGLAWIRKDRKFFHPRAGHDQQTKQKTTKVWIQKRQLPIPSKQTHIGQLQGPQTVNLVSVKDWMSFIRHQQGYKALPTSPGEGNFITTP